MTPLVKEPAPKEPLKPAPAPVANVEKKEDPVETLKRGLDFKDVAPGTLPAGWIGNPESVCIQKNNDQSSELRVISGLTGAVQLPRVALPERFWMEFTMATGDFNSAMAFQFEGTRGEPLPSY